MVAHPQRLRVHCCVGENVLLSESDFKKFKKCNVLHGLSGISNSPVQ